MRSIIYGLYLLIARIAAALYGADGLNLVFMVAPTKVINKIINFHGGKVHPSVRIKAPLTIHNGSNENRLYFKNLFIGANVYIGREAFLDLESPIHIETNVCISHGIKIMTHTDGATSLPARYNIVRQSQAPIHIKAGAYIGAYVLLLEGITVGEGAVIGAGSLVNQSVEPYTVNVGRPARTIRSYTI